MTAIFIMNMNPELKLDWWSKLHRMGLWDLLLDGRIRTLPPPGSTSPGIEGDSDKILESHAWSSSVFLQHKQQNVPLEHHCWYCWRLQRWQAVLHFLLIDFSGVFVLHELSPSIWCPYLLLKRILSKIRNWWACRTVICERINWLELAFISTYIFIVRLHLENLKKWAGLLRACMSRLSEKNVEEHIRWWTC